MRPEASGRLAAELSHALPAAAMVVIRLDELNQSHLPLCRRMIRTILAPKRPTGDWRRDDHGHLPSRFALRQWRRRGHHPRAQYLAALQKPEGAWPRFPSAGSPPDAFVSAFVLFHLIDQRCFQSAVNIDSALNWFHQNAAQLDPETSKLWRSIQLKRIARAAAPALAACA